MKRRVMLLAAVVVGSAVVRLMGQVQPAQKLLAFEIASVKPNKSESITANTEYSPSGRFAITNNSVMDLVVTAYSPLPRSRMTGGPRWIANERFDIVAKAEGTPTVDQLEAMLRTLLADRFKLVVHREKRQSAIYELTQSRTDRRLDSHFRPVAVECSLDASYRLPSKCGGAVWPGVITGEALTMSRLASMLMAALEDHREVLDRTGLSGTFAVNLKFRSDRIPQLSLQAPPALVAAVEAIDPDGPSLFTALQEQLGLKLELKKEQLDVLVIDHVEKPTPD